ncbi:hypothetical protein [Halorussus lipolyticus]|uniref:hypothetical protein n=1 Tax=Halorussus lipolyticus TaxID=3034024 RepID=UPI0023E75D84|nr:hypothetical protein [Halorussus sp. DT80]
MTTLSNDETVSKKAGEKGDSGPEPTVRKPPSACQQCTAVSVSGQTYVVTFHVVEDE